MFIKCLPFLEILSAVLWKVGQLPLRWRTVIARKWKFWTVTVWLQHIIIAKQISAENKLFVFALSKKLYDLEIVIKEHPYGYGPWSPCLASYHL